MPDTAAKPRTTATPTLQNRSELIAALRFAAIIEQMLALEYLYAGFSVRRTLADFPAERCAKEAGRLRALAELDIVRSWLAQTYLITRQEMEHLGIVQNLLGALGEEPSLIRPDFPVSARHTLLHAPFRLDRFGPPALQRFIWYERPSYLTAEFRRRHGDPAGPDLADVEDFILPEFLKPFDSVEKLYEAIQNAFNSLDPTDLFRNDPGRQIPPDMFSLSVQMVQVYNRATATQAIQSILEQGEGISESPQSTDPAHFERFLAILGGLEQAQAHNADLDPALPVVSNPRLGAASFGLLNVKADHVTLITNPHTQRVMSLFDEAYSLMLVMMQSFFGTYTGIYQPEPRPQTALFYAAFFPLMTMVIRPLGEILARMPAHGQHPNPEPGAAHAGPDFAISPAVVDWRTGHGSRHAVIKTVLNADYYRDGLARLAKTAASLQDDVPAAQRENVRQLHQNLDATANHLDGIWNRGQ